jgi:hypothetical protein
MEWSYGAFKLIFQVILWVIPAMLLAAVFVIAIPVVAVRGMIYTVHKKVSGERWFKWKSRAFQLDLLTPIVRRVWLNS